ncbi:hypothetical protein ACHWQZ_G002174 [Mnemiopsis leidyi]
MNESESDVIVAHVSRSADIAFGILELISSLGGLFLNVCTVKFFFKKKSSPTYFLYLCIVLIDILTCLFVLPSSISIMHYREPVLFSSSFVCIASGWVLNITTRMSVYLVAVLSVIRCFTIAPSITSPTLSHAVIPVLVYLIIQIGQASIPLVSSTLNPPIYYLKAVAGCSWGIDDLSFAPYDDGKGVWYRFLVYFCVILPSFLPIFPVVVSCIIFVKIVLTSKQKVKNYRNKDLYNNNLTNSVSLNHVQSQKTLEVEKPADTFCGPRSEVSQMSVSSNFPADQLPPQQCVKKGTSGGDVAQQATTTMCIVTALYIIFNVPYWSFTLAVMFFQADHIRWVTTNGIYINIFLSRTSVVMNAACNPIVYFTRIQALRKLWSIKNCKNRSFTVKFQGLNYWRRLLKTEG